MKLFAVWASEWNLEKAWRVFPILCCCFLSLFFVFCFCSRSSSSSGSGPVWQGLLGEQTVREAMTAFQDWESLADTAGLTATLNTQLLWHFRKTPSERQKKERKCRVTVFGGRQDMTFPFINYDICFQGRLCSGALRLTHDAWTHNHALFAPPIELIRLLRRFWTSLSVCRFLHFSVFLFLLSVCRFLHFSVFLFLLSVCLTVSTRGRPAGWPVSRRILKGFLSSVSDLCSRVERWPRSLSGFRCCALVSWPLGWSSRKILARRLDVTILTTNTPIVIVGCVACRGPSRCSPSCFYTGGWGRGGGRGDGVSDSHGTRPRVLFVRDS